MIWVFLEMDFFSLPVRLLGGLWLLAAKTVEIHSHGNPGTTGFHPAATASR